MFFFLLRCYSFVFVLFSAASGVAARGPMCMRELCLREGSFKVLKLFSFSFLRPELNVMKVVVKYNNVRSVIVHYEV